MPPVVRGGEEVEDEDWIEHWIEPRAEFPATCGRSRGCCGKEGCCRKKKRETIIRVIPTSDDIYYISNLTETKTHVPVGVVWAKALLPLHPVVFVAAEAAVVSMSAAADDAAADGPDQGPRLSRTPLRRVCSRLQLSRHRAPPRPGRVRSVEHRVSFHLAFHLAEKKEEEETHYNCLQAS